MSNYMLQSIYKDIDNLRKDIKETLGEACEQAERLENEVDELRELLLEVRCYCFSSRPANQKIIDYITKFVKERLNYDHPDWEATFPEYDENGNEVPYVIAGADYKKFEDEE